MENTPFLKYYDSAQRGCKANGDLVSGDSGDDDDS